MRPYKLCQKHTGTSQETETLCHIQKPFKIIAWSKEGINFKPAWFQFCNQFFPLMKAVNKFVNLIIDINAVILSYNSTKRGATKL